VTFRPTPGQERLLHLLTRVPTLAYNVTSLCAFAGELHIDVLGSALERVCARHEALRCRVETAPDGLRLRVLPSSSFAFSVQDVTAAGVQEWADSCVVKPCLLSAGVPMRVDVARVGTRLWHVMLSIHHVVADGHSAGIVWREVGAFYAEAFQPAGGAPVPVDRHLPEFAVWQRGWIGASEAEPYRQYWAAGQGARTLATLADRPSAQPSGYVSGCLRHRLGGGATAGVESVVTELGVSRPAVHLGVFAALFMRERRADEFCCATPAANRGAREWAGTVGLLMNLIPLALEAGASTTLAQLIELADARLQDAFAYQAYPVEAFAGQDLAFDAVFAYDRWAGDWSPHLPGLTGRPTVTPAKDVEFPLILTVEDRGSHVDEVFSYRRSDYGPDGIRRVAALLGQLHERAPAVLRQPLRSFL
jgi:hypothetical protein